MKENLQHIKNALGESADVIIREIKISYEGKINVGIIYTAGLSNLETLQSFIMETLMMDIKQTDIENNLTADSPTLTLLKDYAPFVLIVPALFIQFFQSSEDYYQRAVMAGLIRFLRLFFF